MKSLGFPWVKTTASASVRAALQLGFQTDVVVPHGRVLSGARCGDAA